MGWNAPHFQTEPETGLVRAVLHRWDYNAGEVHAGHEHDVDHGTVLHSGRVRIDWSCAKRGTFGTTEFTAPANFLVRADTEHTITALEDGTSWYCIFTPPEGYEQDLRDFWNQKAERGVALGRVRRHG